MTDYTRGFVTYLIPHSAELRERDPVAFVALLVLYLHGLHGPDDGLGVVGGDQEEGVAARLDRFADDSERNRVITVPKIDKDCPPKERSIC